MEFESFRNNVSRCHSTPESSGFISSPPVYSVSEVGFSDTGSDDSENEGCDNNEDVFYDCSSLGAAGQADAEFGDIDPFPEHVIKDEVARFYLKLEGEYVVPTSTVQVISENIKLISQLSHHRLKIALREKLEETNLDKLTIKSIVNATFKCDPIFNIHHKNEDIEQLCTDYLRRQYWQKRFPYVDPKEHCFGTNQSVKKRRAHFVSIRETLKILLKDEKFKAQVLKSFEKKGNESCVLEDISDGQAFMKHKCEHPNGKCIQLLMFQDAFEFNAFGPSASLFKTIGFYYLVANLDADYRSKVDMNQLAGLVLEKDTVPTQQEELDGKDVLKEAIKPILEELEDLKINGIEVDGEKIPVCLLYLIGVSLGQHTIGGYIRNFCCDFFCRFCTMSKAEFKSNPSEVKDLRTPEEYDAAVALAHAKWQQKKKLFELATKKATMRKAKKQANKVKARAPATKKLMTVAIVKEAYKKMCAVSYRAVKYRPSPFNSEVTGFHVSSPALPPCLAHDIFEGILRKILPSVMHYCINEKEWFSLTTLNRRIRSFKYKGSDKRDSPKPYKTVDKLSGNAVRNWNHLRLLPLILGDLIQDPEDEVWQVVLNLKEIVEYVCAPKISIFQVAHLKHLIRRFNISLLKLEKFFPNCLIPKVHFLAHYADLIDMFGPLIRLFTLWFESAHKFFKTVVRNSRNYINITSMMARKYMLRFAFIQGSGGFPADIIYDPTSSSCVNLLTFPPEKRLAFPNNFDPSRSEALTSIIVKGTEYKKGFYLILKSSMDSTSLTVGCIDLILLDSSNKVSFLVEEKEAIESFKGYYELENSSNLEYKLLPHDQLIDYYPLPAYNVYGIDCLSLKHSVCGDV